MIIYFCKPKLKVGTEWVSKGQTCSGASNSVGGIGRKIYELVFRFITDKCNLTLLDPTMRSPNTSAVSTLLVSKFSTTTALNKFVSTSSMKNSNNFSINTCSPLNRKNTFVKVLSGQMLTSVWTCKFVSLCLRNPWVSWPSGKKNLFSQKPHPRAPDKNAHFGVSHYAAMVSYNLTGWLEK